MTLLVYVTCTCDALCRSLGTLSVLFGQVVRAVSSGSRVMEFMNIKPSVALHGGQTFDKNSIRGEVVFKDVTFSYPSRKDQVPLWCV